MLCVFCKDYNIFQKIRHKIVEYLLGWNIIFDHLADATFALKRQYIDHLRDLDVLPKFFEFIVRVLRVGSKGPGSGFDSSVWELSEFVFQGNLFH